MSDSDRIETRPTGSEVKLSKKDEKLMERVHNPQDPHNGLLSGEFDQVKKEKANSISALVARAFIKSLINGKQ